MTDRSISLRELAFVRDVLIPRAWVQGAEVDELVRLRARIESVFAALAETAEGPSVGERREERQC